ncbi:MAG: hypothetical protein WBM46_01185 [Polyangiales bacterium]
MLSGDEAKPRHDRGQNRKPRASPAGDGGHRCTNAKADRPSKEPELSLRGEHNASPQQSQGEGNDQPNERGQSNRSLRRGLGRFLG